MTHLIRFGVAVAFMVALLPVEEGFAQDKKTKNFVALMMTDGDITEGFRDPFEESVWIGDVEVKVKVKPIEHIELSEVANSPRLKRGEDDPAKNTLALNKCFPEAGARQSASAVSIFLVPALKGLFKLAFANADKNLEEKLKKYKKQYGAQSSFAAVRRVGGAGGAVRPAMTCFRLVRGTYVFDPPTRNSAGDTASVEVDLDVQFDLLVGIVFVGGKPQSDGSSLNPAGMQLVPHRWQTAKPLAEGSKVTFSVAASVQGVWLDGGVGTSKKQFDRTIAKGKYAYAGKGADPEFNRYTEYFVPPIGHVDGGVYGNLPLMPIPGKIVPGSDSESENGLGTLTVTVSEAGKGPGKRGLENWKAFLSKSGGGISDGLATAIGGLFEDE